MASRPRDSRAEADRSFERLYAGHRRDVYRAALRALGNADDAEDVTQAAFVDAYRAILRGSRPSAPRAWLLAIAENVRRRRFRAAGRRPREAPLGAEVAAAAELPHEQGDAVRLALAALPPQQREAFLLREVSGLSYGEIAARLDSTVASVQMLLFRARQALRAELDPPSVAPRRRALGLQLPPWLAHLLGRGDALAPGSAPVLRGAGAAGAALLAVGGLTAGALHDRQGEGPPPPAVVREQPRAQPRSAPAAAVPASVTAPKVGRPRRVAIVAAPRSSPPLPTAPAPDAPAAPAAPAPGPAAPVAGFDTPPLPPVLAPAAPTLPPALPPAPAVLSPPPVVLPAAPEPPAPAVLSPPPVVLPAAPELPAPPELPQPPELPLGIEPPPLPPPPGL